MKKTAMLVAMLLVVLSLVASAKTVELVKVAEFSILEANQGIGVDERYFYAVDNRVVAKYDKKTGALINKYVDPEGGQIKHLDSAMALNGKLYCAHSNYPEWPMTSSVEIFDTFTMEHVGTHSFGINYGSLTWFDYYDGYWWATFANYDNMNGPDIYAVNGTNKTLYGNKLTTQMVKFDDQWRYLESWILPKSILDRFELMSNSGGTWGPDGFLYLSGHDPAEIYKMSIPKAGSILVLEDVLTMGIRGQGIAWDRSEPGVIWGIVRSTSAERKEGITHKVVAYRMVITP